MKNLKKRLAGLSLGLLLSLGVVAAVGQHEVLDVKAEDLTATFDLTTTKQVTEATSDSLVYTAGSQVFSIAKNKSSTSAINYCPSTSEKTYTETRAYNGSKITIDAGTGYLVKSAVFTYSSAVDLSSDTWTDATFDKETGTATASGSSQTISVVLTGTRKMKKVVLTYTENSNPSISLDKVGELKIGDTGTFTYTTSKATESSVVVTWSSSNTSVLTVDTAGKYNCLEAGTTTVKADMTCTEGSASASVDIVVNKGLVTIAEAKALGANLEKGETTSFKVTVEGYITNLDYDGETRMIVLSNEKSGASDANSLNVFGIYSNNDLRKIAIIDGQVTIEGKLNNYNGSLQLTGPEWSDYTIDAGAFANYFVSSLTAGACAEPAKDNTEDLKTAWTDLKAKWDCVDETSKGTLKAATEDDATYGAFVKLYDHIMTRYGEAKLGEGANFVGRALTASVSGAPLVLSASNNSLTITIIVLVSILSVSLIIGTTLIIRKRKVN